MMDSKTLDKRILAPTEMLILSLAFTTVGGALHFLITQLSICL
ncbi:hypothetical protein CI610_01564 [invertebrate metagenome]|uniref:Uncharacterized protein n=1 Tax=invertebrate metagenome TaxID=1711999 RepID=A0A2H9T8E4_9ZZZZ